MVNTTVNIMGIITNPMIKIQDYKMQAVDKIEKSDLKCLVVKYTQIGALMT
jgi:hypothetical protein